MYHIVVRKFIDALTMF